MTVSSSLEALAPHVCTKKISPPREIYRNAISECIESLSTLRSDSQIEEAEQILATHALKWAIELQQFGSNNAPRAGVQFSNMISSLYQRLELLKFNGHP